ncbi:MAG: hypothetical protein FD160_1102 [Caulobacteraceae bacterium]|nr:MAG: hypothetical protein FD160_1102 [Caulobacteraceae bacterium]
MARIGAAFTFGFRWFQRSCAGHRPAVLLSTIQTNSIVRASITASRPRFSFSVDAGVAGGPAYQSQAGGTGRCFNAEFNDGLATV